MRQTFQSAEEVAAGNWFETRSTSPAELETVGGRNPDADRNVCNTLADVIDRMRALDRWLFLSADGGS